MERAVVLHIARKSWVRNEWSCVSRPLELRRKNDMPKRKQHIIVFSPWFFWKSYHSAPQNRSLPYPYVRRYALRIILGMHTDLQMYVGHYIPVVLLGHRHVDFYIQQNLRIPRTSAISVVEKPESNAKVLGES